MDALLRGNLDIICAQYICFIFRRFFFCYNSWDYSGSIRLKVLECLLNDQKKPFGLLQVSIDEGYYKKKWYLKKNLYINLFFRKSIFQKKTMKF